MSEFTPITTQEEFDAAISKRLKRERETITAQFGDYDDLKKKVSEHETTIGNLTQERDTLKGQVKAHETNSVKMRIAHETGIPFEMASRLSGDTEDAIRADAETMAKYIHKPITGPLRSTEPAGVGDGSAALRQMLHNLKGD